MKPISLRCLGLCGLLAGLLSGCEQPSLLERLQEKQHLKIATVGGALQCYSGLHGPAGVEYRLVSEFARQLGLQPEFTVYPNRLAALQAVNRGEQHMAAAFMAPTQAQLQTGLPSIPWHQTRLVVVQSTKHKRKLKTPDSIQAPINVPLASMQHQLLLQEDWPLKGSHDSEETLLHKVNNQDIEATLASVEQLDAHKPLLPLLSRRWMLPDPVHIHWMFSPGYGHSLRDAANDFLAGKLVSGELNTLIEQESQALPKQDFVTRRDFWRAVRQRLPQYEAMFRAAAKETGLDWRLLAAISYQESHWKPKAKSPAGAVGMMMLTRDAARQHKLKDRENAEQNIHAGAKHILWMMERLPKRIQGEDQLWFTLASYNIGYGHLEDARILTQRQKADPDRWDEVKKRLPLLSEEAYYRTVKHGKARGGEPVAYIRNIRYFLDLLIRWDNARNQRYCDHPEDSHLRLLRKKPRSKSALSSASTPP